MRAKQGCCRDMEHFAAHGKGSKGCTNGGCMNLPASVTCGGCVHIARCTAMFGHTESDTYCDWFPSRFRAKP